jgi:hypothetical protein
LVPAKLYAGVPEALDRPLPDLPEASHRLDTGDAGAM